MTIWRNLRKQFFNRTVSSFLTCKPAIPALLIVLALLYSSPVSVEAQPNSSFRWSLNGLKLSVSAIDGRPGLSYRWSFGDGGSSSGRSASHSYAEAGVYTVILRVTDSDNVSRSSYEDIRVTAQSASATDRSKRGAARIRYRPPQKTCETLPAEFVRVKTSGFSVQCQLIESHAAIGNPQIIAAGPLAAVDVWGSVAAGTPVCFWQTGRIVLLDATTSPRSIVELAVYLTEGWTCAPLDRAGTVVLLPGEPSVEGAAQPPVRTTIDVPDAIWQDDSPAVALSDCRVITRVFVNFRQSPGGPAYENAVIRYGRAFEALARTEHWFEVRYQDKLGWITAHLVRTAGDCELPEALAIAATDAAADEKA